MKDSKRAFVTSVGLILMPLLAGSAYPQKDTCSESQGRAALYEAVTVRSWGALYKSYKSYRRCDDGAIGEGYSASVARILVNHWSTLSRLAQLGNRDTEFRAFVLRHVDATLKMDDVEKIKTRADGQCPNGLRTLCDDLARQADSALKENVSAR